jgi:chemotaxis signal transduction protein
MVDGGDLMAGIDGPVTPAADLRAAFDAAFAIPAAAAPAATVDVLAIRAAGVSYAAKVSEISAVFADRPVTPLPGSLPELLGVAEARGTVMPIYDLGALLGHAAVAWPTTMPRWVLVAGGPTPVGLAFGAFEGHLRIPAAGAEPAGDRKPSDDLPAGAVVNGQLRPIINVPALLSGIAARVGRQSRGGSGGP